MRVDYQLLLRTNSAMSFPARKICCDPFKRHHKVIKRDLRPVRQAVIDQVPLLRLTRDQYVCSFCRKLIDAQIKTVAAFSAEATEHMDDEATHPVDDSHDTISVVNSEDEESALSSGSGQTSSGWSGNNDAGSSNAKKRKAEGDEGQRTTLSVSDAEEMVQQLKEKFRSATTRSERIKILTVLPKSWSKRKIAKEFGVSRYLVRRAKKLVAEKGILSSPNPKGGRALPVEIEEEVHTFFWSDSISRTMPGKKDFLSVKGADGKRVHRQKRLVLCNLKEAYREFKLCHPDMKIGFTKFSLLRPKECVLAGASGTHSVCVCTIHQNTKLMMVGSKLEILTGGKFKHYRHCLAAMQCNPPNVGCYFGECELCPGTEPLHTCLQDAMDRNDVDAVEFQQWTTTDCATLETKVLSVNEFLDTFVTMVKKLLVHDFVAKQQTAFMQKTKESLKEGEFLVIADFSENYSFVVQDEVQSFHWNNGSATIHPFVCYYVAEGTLNTLCYVVISECNQHDTIAVHLFQRKLLDFITRECGGKRPQKVYYMSDGCAAQYKNCKNFTNLCYHLDDFGVRAEWHFFATSHGKSAGDGAGGTLKRVACRASLQRPYQDQILTARQLYEFAITEIKGMDFTFASQEEHDREASLLEERLKASRTVPGTQKLHSFVPLSNNTVEVKSFSNSGQSRIEKVALAAGNVQSLPISAMGGYVTVAYNESCWLGCVTNTNESQRAVTVMFLHPKIPAKSFVYPAQDDVMDVDPSDVLTRVSPTTDTGRLYKLTKKEMDEASQTLAARCVDS